MLAQVLQELQLGHLPLRDRDLAVSDLLRLKAGALADLRHELRASPLVAWDVHC